MKVIFIITLLFANLAAEDIELMQNNKMYPLWYLRILDGTSCVANVKIESVKQDVAISSVQINHPKITKSNLKFASIHVRFTKIQYTPAFFHIENIGLLNAFKSNSKFELFLKNEEISTVDISALTEGNELLVLVSPSYFLGPGNLEIVEVISIQDVPKLERLLKVLPKFEERGDKLFMSINSKSEGTHSIKKDRGQ